MDKDLESRRKSLEEAFFANRERELAAEHRARQEREKQRESLREIVGIENQELVDALLARGLNADTMTALLLVPLVEVAWADRSMDPSERKAILEAAEESGIRSGSPAMEMLESWLSHRPGPGLAEVWKEYIADLTANLDADKKASLRREVMETARGVATAAGGLLGLASISAEERAKLAELEKAFG